VTEDAEVSAQVPKDKTMRNENRDPTQHTAEGAPHPAPTCVTGLHLSGRSGGHFQWQLLQVGLRADGCGFLQGRRGD
jgi:hypothetical protein